MSEPNQGLSMRFWNTCKWRSEKIPTTIHSCCGNRNEVVECFNCLKLDIKQLIPTHCSNCAAYESK